MSSPLMLLRHAGAAAVLAAGFAVPALAGAPGCPPGVAPSRVVTMTPGSRLVLTAAPGSVIVLSGGNPVRVTALPAAAAARLPGLHMMAYMQRMMQRMTRQVDALFAAPLGPFGPGGLWRAAFAPGLLAPVGGPGVRSCAASVSYRIGPNGRPILHVVQTGNACGQMRLLGPGLTPAAAPQPASPPGMAPAAGPGPRLIPAVYRVTAPAPAR